MHATKESMPMTCTRMLRNVVIKVESGMGALVYSTRISIKSNTGSTWSSLCVHHNAADELICTVLVTLETAISPQNIL